MKSTSKLGRDGSFWGLVMVAPTIIGLMLLNIIPFFQTIATAAGATTMGRKKMARKAVFPLMFAFSSTATISARKTPTGTVRMQK